MLAFEKRLRKQNPRTGLVGAMQCDPEYASQFGMRHLGDPRMIAITSFIGQPDGLTDLYAKACAKVMAQVSRHRDKVAMYGG